MQIKWCHSQLNYPSGAPTVFRVRASKVLPKLISCLPSPTASSPATPSSWQQSQAGPHFLTFTHAVSWTVLSSTYQLSTVAFGKSPPLSEIQLTPHYSELIMMPASQVPGRLRKTRWENAQNRAWQPLAISPSYGGRSLFLANIPLGNYTLFQGSFSHHPYLNWSHFPPENLTLMKT